MMGMVEVLRQAHERLIAENPVQITITRTEKIEMDGAFQEQVSTVGPITVRIFQANTNKTQDVSTLAGTKQVDTRWGLLTDVSADIKAGTNVKDEFDALGYRFLIVAVHPQMILGQLYGYQADLERVS